MADIPFRALDTQTRTARRARAAAARDLVTPLMTGGHHGNRMLAGPHCPEDDFEDRINIDDLSEPRLDFMGADIMEEFGMTPPKARLDRKGLEDLSRMLIARAREGEPLSVRGDGIAFYAISPSDEPDWVVAQIAVGKDEDGAETLAGIYYHTSLLVDECFRGQGVGTGLVVEHMLANKGMLIWESSSCDYSPGGAATHLAGLRVLMEMAGIEAPEPEDDPEAEPD